MNIFSSLFEVPMVPLKDHELKFNNVAYHMLEIQRALLLHNMFQN